MFQYFRKRTLSFRKHRKHPSGRWNRVISRLSWRLNLSYRNQNLRRDGRRINSPQPPLAPLCVTPSLRGSNRLLPLSRKTNKIVAGSFFLLCWKDEADTPLRAKLSAPLANSFAKVKWYISFLIHTISFDFYSFYILYMCMCPLGLFPELADYWMNCPPVTFFGLNYIKFLRKQK